MSIEFLHQGLSEDGKTVKSLQQFKNDYSTKENQLALYNGLIEDGEFDGSFVEFQNKYFPTQTATTTIPTSTKPYVAPVTKTGEKSEEDLLIEQDAVNKEFWDPEKNPFSKRYGFKREDFSKNKDDKWVHVLDNGETVLLEDAEKLRMPEYKKVLSELNDEDIRIGQQTKSGTYGDVEERVAITSDDVWEGEKGTKEHKAWVKKKQEQAGQMREDQKVERKVKQETKQEIISDEEELDLVFEPYMRRATRGLLNKFNGVITECLR